MFWCVQPLIYSIGIVYWIYCFEFECTPIPNLHTTPGLILVQSLHVWFCLNIIDFNDKCIACIIIYNALRIARVVRDYTTIRITFIGTYWTFVCAVRIFMVGELWEHESVTTIVCTFLNMLVYLLFTILLQHPQLKWQSLLRNNIIHIYTDIYCEENTEIKRIHEYCSFYEFDTHWWYNKMENMLKIE